MHHSSAPWAGLLIAFGLAATSHAVTDGDPGDSEAGTLAVPPVVELGSGSWQPPQPDDAKLDWILLQTGEWIRGSLDRIEDGTVYFDSEEFDDIDVDWVDVVELRSPRMKTYRLQPPDHDDDVIVAGTAGLVGGTLRIQSADGIQEFDARDLVSMVKGGGSELDYWSFEASFGVTARTGNTDQTDVTTFAKVQRETALTRIYLQYRGSSSSVSGDTTSDSHRGNFQIDTYLTRRLFLVAPTVDLFRDTFQNISLRASTGIGVGYDVLKWSWIQWEVGAGVMHQFIEFDTVQVDDPGSSHDVAVSLATNLELDPVSGVEWDTSYRILPVVTDFDNTSHNLTTVISIEVWGPLDLDVTAIWDRVVKPPEDANGVRPESDDFLVTVGLAIDF